MNFNIYVLVDISGWNLVLVSDLLLLVIQFVLDIIVVIG